MTPQIKDLLDEIKSADIFENLPLYFVGGTALSCYLKHRVSYDIDIACTSILDVSKINSFMYKLGARVIQDKNASAYKINTGDDIRDFHMKFMLKDVKIEFSYFKDPLQEAVLETSDSAPYDENCKLKLLGLNGIIQLKAYALFNRQKTRDLFDMAIILQSQLMSLEELSRIYSYANHIDKTLTQYIEGFDHKDDEGVENSLDFLPEHEHYKSFAKLKQDERFKKAKEMFLTEYEKLDRLNHEKVRKQAVKNLHQK